MSVKLKRRSLLLGLGALTLGAMLPSCRSQTMPTLRIQLLSGSLPVQLFRQFQRQLERRISLDAVPQSQITQLYNLLLNWKAAQESEQSWRVPSWVPFVGSQTPKTVVDLVTLGDYWLTTAIAEGLIAPFAANELIGLQQLDAKFQALVTRDRTGKLDPTGKIWAAPYRWGTAMIAYRREEFDKLGWVPTDWSDLWRPELHQRISLPDNPRVVIGAVLKELGQSINRDRLDPTVTTALTELHRQVKFYSSNAYLQPLLLGDTWAAVGWSTDILPLVKGDRRIAAIVPASGTILTADVWVRPVGAPSSPTTEGQPSLVSQWFDFCWQVETATQMALLGSNAASPLLGGDRDQLPQSVQDNSLLLPSADILERSEFLHPLTATAVEDYRRLWISLRQSS